MRFNHFYFFRKRKNHNDFRKNSMLCILRRKSNIPGLRIGSVALRLDWQSSRSSENVQLFLLGIQSTITSKRLLNLTQIKFPREKLKFFWLWLENFQFLIWSGNDIFSNFDIYRDTFQNSNVLKCFTSRSWSRKVKYIESLMIKLYWEKYRINVRLNYLNYLLLIYISEFYKTLFTSDLVFISPIILKWRPVGIDVLNMFNTYITNKSNESKSG